MGKGGRNPGNNHPARRLLDSHYGYSLPSRRGQVGFFLVHDRGGSGPPLDDLGRVRQQRDEEEWDRGRRI